MGVVITDRPGAGKILCSPRRRSEVAYVVSIGSPTDRLPAGWQNATDKLRLVFEDSLSEAEGGPSVADVDRLIWFAQRVDLKRGAILVHCQSGISRSVAAAAILLAVTQGRGREAAALEEALAAQPAGRPNERMLELADAALGNGGALMQAWQKVRVSGRRTSA